MFLFPHIFSRGFMISLHHMVILSLSGPLTSLLVGVGENFQSQDLRISSCLDHLLRKPSMWLDGRDIFSVFRQYMT